MIELNVCLKGRMTNQKTKISDFLEEREDRYSPEEATKMGLRRIDKIDSKGNMYISNKKSKTNMILIKPGDLVISGIGLGKGSKGSVCIHQGDESLLATIHYSSYIIDKNKICPLFLEWLFKSKFFRKILKENSPGGIKAEYKPKHLLPIEIPLPPKEKQKEIVERLNYFSSKNSEVNNLQIQNQKLIQKLKEKILQEAVQGKLTEQDPNDEPASELLKKIKSEKQKLIKEGKIKKQKPLPEITEEEKPFEIPDNWVWCRLGEITNYGHGDKINPNEINEDIWTLELEDIEKSTSRLLRRVRNRERKVKSTKNVFEKGDVLYSKLRPYLDKVFVADKGGVCTTEIIPIRSYGNFIDPFYLKIFLKNPNFIENVNSITHGMDMPRLGTNKGKSMMMAMPPLQEQKRIVENVDKLMSYCDELEERTNENQKYSEKLMDAVLSEVF